MTRKIQAGMAGTRAVLRAAILAAASLSAILPAAAADDPPPAGDGVAVVELFLSQACTACPPAAALMPALAARPDVIALSWHVDYWNMTDGPKGRWTDPFARRAFTERQRRYNLRIRKRSSVYTPQTVVNGTAETVGSKIDSISTLIDSAPRAARIEGERTEDGIMFAVGESESGGNAYLVVYHPRAATNITSGGNAGRRFDEVNVVTGVEPLGVVSRRGGAVAAPAPVPGEGCALIVQEPRQQRIVAAGLCPQ